MSPRKVMSLTPRRSFEPGSDVQTDVVSDRIAVSYVAIANLRPSPHNARNHPAKQIDQLVLSIVEHGFVSPLLVDENLVLIAGHGRLLAAKKIGLPTVPAIVLRGLSEVQKRKLMIADNKIAGNSAWDREKLAIELQDLVILDDFVPAAIGFDAPEIDDIIADLEPDAADPADTIVPSSTEPVSGRGDLWLLGGHRLLCGDACEATDFSRLMAADRAAMAFTDPPYNLRVKGLVGRGQTKHQEFAMASGEMNAEQFAAFLATSLGHAAAYSRDGAVHYVCMDWRHIDVLIGVGRDLYGQMLNLVTWVKSNAGQGSFYRSQHELICVFRVGEGQHLNNVELGRHGRNRSNVWHYAGVNSFGPGRMADLTVHPTVKPVAMVVDALKDCTRRGDIVLDCFGGSGTTLLAAERTGRKARLIEYEPGFVDATIRRWQAFTGKDAVNAETGRLFDDIAAAGNGEAA